MREGHATIQSRNGSTVPLTLFGLTKTFTCVQLSNTYLSATLTTATFPTAAACRGFDASACTPTPRDLLSSHWQLRLHLIWKVANPLYIAVRLVAHGQVSVLRKSLVSLVAWEKWVGHWPYDLWPDQNQSVQKRLLPYVCLPNLCPSGLPVWV